MQTHEVPLRPPRDSISSTKILRDGFNKSMQIHHDCNDRDTSMQASFVPELHNNSFHTTLYDELAPEDDNIKQLEQSLRSTETVL